MRPTGSTASGNKLTPTDIGTLLVSAVRYALGRRTYIVGLTCDIVRRAKPSPDVRAILLRDINDCPDYGMSMDAAEWRHLREWLGSPHSVGAVDPHVADTGKPSTRVKKRN